MANFYIRLSSIDVENGNAVGRLVGEKGELTMPVFCMMQFVGRVDAIVSYFVEGFLHDDVFEEGDHLLMATESKEKAILLLQRKR